MKLLKFITLLLFVSCSLTKPAAIKTAPVSGSASESIAVNPAFNIKDFGAIGSGIASLHADSLALWKAIDSIRRVGVGSLIIPRGTYAFSGNGIILPDNIEIILQGEIRHVNPNDSKFFEGTIFYLNTYDATSEMDSTVPRSAIQNVKKGAAYITMINSLPIKVGEVVLIGGSLQPVPGKANHYYFSVGELNAVKSISGTRVYLKYPASVSISSAPTLVQVNSGKSFTSPLKVPDRVAQNVYIHGPGKLSQADSDEIHHLPLEADVKPRSVIMGGGFECRIVGITTVAHGCLPSGNMFSRCIIDSITAIAKDKLFDCGYNTHNSTFSNITTQMLAYNDTNALISLNQGLHNVRLINYKIAGEWTGNKLISFNYADSITVKNISISLPNFDATKGIIVGANSSNVLIDGANVKVKQCSKLVNVDAGAKGIVIKNVVQ